MEIKEIRIFVLEFVPDDVRILVRRSANFDLPTSRHHFRADTLTCSRLVVPCMPDFFRLRRDMCGNSDVLEDLKEKVAGRKKASAPSDVNLRFCKKKVEKYLKKNGKIKVFVCLNELVETLKNSMFS